MVEFCDCTLLLKIVAKTPLVTCSELLLNVLFEIDTSVESKVLVRLELIRLNVEVGTNTVVVEIAFPDIEIKLPEVLEFMMPLNPAVPVWENTPCDMTLF